MFTQNRRGKLRGEKHLVEMALHFHAGRFKVSDGVEGLEAAD